MLQEFFTKLSSPADSTFKDSQYYWAEPRLFTKDKSPLSMQSTWLCLRGMVIGGCLARPRTTVAVRSRACVISKSAARALIIVAAPLIAVVRECPGAACCQSLFNPVNINGDITSPGYGERAGGNLKTWIIHSCEVIPTPEDTAYWATPLVARFWRLTECRGLSHADEKP